MRLRLVLVALCLSSSLRAQPAAKPEAVGMSSERLQRMHRVLQGFVDRGEEPGIAWLVTRNGKLVDRGAVGMQDVARKQPMRADTIVRMASMTKPITAVGIMILVEDGKLLLTDSVSRYIPALHDLKVVGKDGKLVPAERDITIRDLLTHRAGFTYDFFDRGPVGDAYRKLGVSDGVDAAPMTLEENIARLAKAPLVDQPGHDFHYGLSYDVLGRVIEVVSGQPLDRFFAERIFKPLKMNDTSFAISDAKQPRLATVYVTDKTELRPLGDPEPLRIGPMPLPTAPNQQYRAPHLFSGGAGLLSTASDYARLLEMLLRGGELDGARILSPKTVQLMTASHTRDLPHGLADDGRGFGLGFSVIMDQGAAQSPRSVGSYAWAGVFGTAFAVDPKEKLITILLTQHPTGDLRINDVFTTMVYAAITTPD